MRAFDTVTTTSPWPITSSSNCSSSWTPIQQHYNCLQYCSSHEIQLQIWTRDQVSLGGLGMGKGSGEEGHQKHFKEMRIYQRYTKTELILHM